MTETGIDTGTHAVANVWNPPQKHGRFMCNHQEININKTFLQKLCSSVYSESPIIFDNHQYLNKNYLLNYQLVYNFNNANLNSKLRGSELTFFASTKFTTDLIILIKNVLNKYFFWWKTGK